jgi:hypothetical protein
MHESGAFSWREVVEKHHTGLIEELSLRLDADLRGAVDAERSHGDEMRRAQVESLNQALRRLRTIGEGQVLNLVAESCARYAERLVVLVFESNQAHCAAVFGIETKVPAFATDSARAVLTAIDSRDPVTALATAAEISPELAETFGVGPDGKAYLFPIVARHTVVAMLIASGAAAQAGGQSAPVELLCEAAGMRLEAVMSAGAAIEAPAGTPKSEAAMPGAWEDLGAEDQKLHLQAQRTARVRVAEMRMYHEDQVKSGAARGDIYGALRHEIDAARDEFLKTYLAKSSTMVDYLHLEILHNLAHDEDRALGHNYPGPMV